MPTSVRTDALADNYNDCEVHTLFEFSFCFLFVFPLVDIHTPISFPNNTDSTIYSQHLFILFTLASLQIQNHSTTQL